MPPLAHSPLIARTPVPPVMEVRRWLAEAPQDPDRPVINLSQAAPVDPPPPELVAHMAQALQDPDTHLYGAVLGDDDLRAEIASRWSVIYGGAIEAADVAVTAGCNQAFATAVAALAAPGDNVILPVPWYFNHRMWLDMSGIEARALPVGPDMLPDPADAARLIDARTRAIVLVTPNNPTGTEYPPALLRAFADLARAHGLALIVDETYRDFLAPPGAPHDLFQDPDWRDTLVHLYSFSKVFRLTGHRVGAVVAAPGLLAQAEKFLDTVAICPPRLGQRAALFGLRHLSQWVAAERAEILARRAAVTAGMQDMPGWRLRGCGAYFAWIEHPFDCDSATLARRMVREAGLLLLPGTMFAPDAPGAPGQQAASRALRMAYANADVAGLGQVLGRMRALSP